MKATNLSSKQENAKTTGTTSVVGTERVYHGPKKSYRAPQLTCCGSVAELTQTKGGSGNDGSGHFSKQCWIAEVLYGLDAPRTRIIRVWLTECYDRRDWWALIAVPLYRGFGQRVAGFLRKYPVAQAAFRPLFDRAISKAHVEYSARLLCSHR
jgi:hypothetical protein